MRERQESPLSRVRAREPQEMRGMIWEYKGLRYVDRTQASSCLTACGWAKVAEWVHGILSQASDTDTVAERYATHSDSLVDRLFFAMGEAERYLEEHRDVDILRFDDLLVRRDDAVFKRRTSIDGREYLINLCRDCPFLVSAFNAADLCNHPGRVRRMVRGECYPPECCPLSGVRRSGGCGEEHDEM